MSNFSRVNRELLHDFSFFSVVKDTIHESTLDKTFSRNAVSHIGAVAVIPVLENGDIALIKQYRGTIDQESLEAVAGRRDVENEDLETCAKRELAEEIGYSTNELVALGFVHTTPGFCDEKIYLFLAKDCQKLEENEPDGLEEQFAQTITTSIDKAIEWALDGTITDGKTIANLFRAANVLGFSTTKI